MQALLPDGAALVDYLKVGPFMGEQTITALAADYPLMLHLDDTLSGHNLPSADTVQRLTRWIELTGAPWTSEHIGFSVADVDLDSALITQPSQRCSHANRHSITSRAMRGRWPRRCPRR
jgi:uncharacterized protein (UPF0276 family)